MLAIRFRLTFRNIITIFFRAGFFKKKFFDSLFITDAPATTTGNVLLVTPPLAEYIKAVQILYIRFTKRNTSSVNTKNYPKEQFTGHQFDPALIDQAFTLSEALSQAIVYVTVFRGSVLADALQKRNELFIQTRQLMLTICVIGRNAYNNNPESRKNFSRVG
jgi:hypothetical protein